ncbi:MAG: hypothetical protein MUC65_06935, partial [Pontiellaceae bacterium]|nr:hypothetical protein [Pontiellaceae bacterium]
AGLTFNNTNSKVDLRGGTVLLAGNQTAAVTGCINAGNITAYGGAGTLAVDYNVSNPGYTTIQALPCYAAWAASFGVELGLPDEDYDGDSRNNFYEYALNGNPTNSLNTGVEPTYVITGGNLVYRHLQRTDDASLIYRVETRTNLVAGTWIPAQAAVNTNAYNADFVEVINTTPADQPKLYIRLKIIDP